MYTVYLTTRCNLNCSYCYENYNEKLDINFEISKKTIDYIFKNDFSSIVQIGFMGGEPLIRYDVLFQIVNYIKQKYPARKVKYYITTNGVLLNEDMIEFLSMNNFDIRVSIDGDKNSTSINRMANNIAIYDQVINNIDKMSDYNCNFSLRMTVTKDVINKLFENVDFLYMRFKKPIDLQFDLNMVVDDALRNILEDEIKKLVNYYLYINANKYNTKLQIDQIDGKYVNILADFDNGFGMCDAGISSFSFMPNGNVYPCAFVTNLKEFCIGDIYKGISIDRSKELAIRNFDISQGKCKDCHIKFFCHGMKCGYLNYIRSGKINIPSELTCIIEKTFYKELMYILNYFLEDDIRIEHLSEQLNKIIYLIEWNNIKLSSIGYKIKAKLEEI